MAAADSYLNTRFNSSCQDALKMSFDINQATVKEAAFVLKPFMADETSDQHNGLICHPPPCRAISMPYAMAGGLSIQTSGA